MGENPSVFSQKSLHFEKLLSASLLEMDSLQESSLFSSAGLQPLVWLCPLAAAMPPCTRWRWMDPSSETQESANFCSGEIHTQFFYSPEFIYSNLSEAVIIFVSGDKRRRETGTICSLFKARSLKSFCVFRALMAGKGVRCWFGGCIPIAPMHDEDTEMCFCFSRSKEAFQRPSSFFSPSSDIQKGPSHSQQENPISLSLTQDSFTPSSLATWTHRRSCSSKK